MEDKIAEFEKEKKQTRKEINEMKKELKTLKEDYKQCMEALRNETYNKNKAEILCKALKEKIELEKDMNSSKTNENTEKEAQNSDSDMSVDEDEFPGLSAYEKLRLRNFQELFSLVMVGINEAKHCHPLL